MRIAVVGAGVAGSVFSLLLSRRRDIDFTVYEMSKEYTKPCGEAIPANLLDVLEVNQIPLPRILNTIKVFKVYTGKELVKTIEYDDNLWYTIDKNQWIKDLRALFSEHIVYKPVRINTILKEKYDLVVDARGPFGQMGEKITVWRAYLESVGWPRDTVVLSFTNIPGIGLTWIFPHNDVVNVGAGFIGVANPRNNGFKLIARIMYEATGEKPKIIKESMSIITIAPRVILHEKRVIVRIGEAAGLINSLGGEGIRPAVLSAIAAYRALRVGRGFDYTLYRRYLKDLLRSVYLQARILHLVRASSGFGMRRILSMISGRVYKKWFTGQLGIMDVLFAFF